MRILLCVLVVGLVGCSGKTEGPETVTVSGKVTLNGQPLPSGEIIFRDTQGKSRSDAGTIADGSYSFESTLGNKRVEITSIQVKPGTEGQTLETGEAGGEMEQIIPEKYNGKSELTADVSESSTTFTFELIK